VPDTNILNTARSLIPLLKERASETESIRRLPDNIVHHLSESGLFNLMLPPGLGGQGPDLENHLKVASILAEGCGSSSWVMSLVGYQNYLLGWFPPAVQLELKETAGQLFTGLVMGPPVTAERRPGGCTLNGIWPYVSGAHFANWFLLSAKDPDNEARVLTCLVPSNKTSLIEDWITFGLKGTGSVSVKCEGCFIPNTHILCFREAERDGVPGASINQGPLFEGVPTSTMFALVVAAPSLGLAKASIEYFKRRVLSRQNARMPSSQAEWPSSQARLGKAAASLNRANRSFWQAVQLYQDVAKSRKEFPLDLRAELRMEAVETVRTCTKIVYDLFCDSGTGVTREGDELQRVFRDIHTLRTHFMILPDIAAENAGRIQLGLDPKAPFTAG
jgi:3-hydroxy-9,10-secoandrosta-1,3,5(10)-triene-9,17-dione monooxygenase